MFNRTPWIRPVVLIAASLFLAVAMMPLSGQGQYIPPPPEGPFTDPASGQSYFRLEIVDYFEAASR